MKNYICSILMLSLIFMLFGCQSAATKPYTQVSTDIMTATKEISTDVQKSTTETVTETIVETATQTTEVSLIAIGDILTHMTVVWSGAKSDGTYRYHHLFRNIKDDIDQADIAVLNQETILKGTVSDASGYPKFQAPYLIGDAEADVGFDVILSATNHTMDQGVSGVESSINYWRNNYPDMLVVGVNASKKARDTIPIIEKNGIKIAILNYTYGLNGHVLPEDKPYLVNLIDKQKIVSDIKKAQTLSDYIIVFPHWGIQYQHAANDEQIALAQMMADAGADLIIGGHPHVLQNVERLTGENGNQTLCYYSLGNFVSTQIQTDTMLGGMARVNIQKKGDELTLVQADLVPLATYYNRSLRIAETYKLSDYPSELIASHGILSDVPDFSLEKLHQLANDIVGQPWLSKN